MSDNNEPVDLEAIEARLKAATPGPWEFFKGNEKYGEQLEPLRHNNTSIAALVSMNGGETGIKFEDADAEFIANAPTDIAALLQRVRQLEAELAEINKPPLQRLRERVDAKRPGREKFMRENPDYDPLEAFSKLSMDIDPEILRTCLYEDEEE